MADINVTAHGIDPKTGEYLSPAQRKALFKKGKMGSKIKPDSFRSGVASGTKGESKSLPNSVVAIVPFSPTVDPGALVPNEEPVQKVNVEDLGSTETAPENKDTFKDALKNLLNTLKRVVKIKTKQKNASDKTSRAKGKGKKEKEKKKTRKTVGRDIFGIGRKIRGKVQSTFGDIFGIFGDIIAFAALNWISDPKNYKMVKGIIEFAGKAFSFITNIVGAFVGNAMTGLSQLLGPDRSLGERFIGALRLISGFFLLRWLFKPWKIIKDVRRLIKIFSKFGKFVNKILRKPIKIIQNFVKTALNKTIGKLFKSNLFKPIRKFIVKVFGKSVLKLLGAVGRGFVKIISRVPFIGALLQFFMDVFLFKKPPLRSGFKAIGGALIGAIGMIGGPLGGIIGGFVGSEAGGWLYDAWFGSGHNPEDVKDEYGRKTSEGGEIKSQGVGTGTSPSNSALPGQDERGPSPTGYASAAAGNWTPILNLIAAHESVGGSYDSAYPSTTKQHYSGGPPLTEMTIAEADAWQAQTYRARGSAAAGRYQFMKIKEQAAAAGIGSDELFSAENQDKMAIHLLTRKRKITMDMIKNNPNEAMIRLGMEWAAFPMPVAMQGAKQRVNAGQSYYAGDGRNAAGATISEVKRVFAGMGGGLGVPERKNYPLGKDGAKEFIKDRKSYGSLKTPTPATNLNVSVKNTMMPSMSQSFAINEKIKSKGIVDQPLIVNNIKEDTVHVTANSITPTLNNSINTSSKVLNRL